MEWDKDIIFITRIIERYRMQAVLLYNKEGAPVYWTPDYIKERMRISDITLIASMLRIYSYQTAVEQASDTTNVNNYCGFNSADAEILSSLSKQCLKAESRAKGYGYRCLSPKQLGIAREKMEKYAGQVFKYMKAEYADKVVTVPKTKVVKGTGKLILI